MSGNSRYQIMVFSDQFAEHKQFSLSRRAVRAAFGVGAFVLVAMAGMGWSLYDNISAKAELKTLQEENKKLKQANEQYLQATIEIEGKLEHFQGQTYKLARFVGADFGSEVGGIGGRDMFDRVEYDQYLRHDLGFLRNMAQQLDEQLVGLEEDFQKRAGLLAGTPSILPSRGWISSSFGYRTDPFTGRRAHHKGLDISCPKGTPVYAPADGVVSFRGYQGGFGNMVELTHSENITTKFGHLSKFNVSKGQRVKRGDLIAFVGSTGRSTAPHLHYEVHVDDKPQNPMRYIFDEGRSL